VDPSLRIVELVCAQRLLEVGTRSLLDDEMLLAVDKFELLSSQVLQLPSTFVVAVEASLVQHHPHKSQNERVLAS
jgi:hypothetical protein